MQLTVKEVEDAMNFLSDTAIEFGTVKAYVRIGPYTKNLVKAKAYLSSDAKHRGETVAAKEAMAYASTEYEEFVDKLAESAVRYYILEGERETANKKFEMWRTLSANQR